MFMWCIEVLQSHTRFISFRLLFLFFQTHNQDFAGVQSRENRLPTQDIAVQKNKLLLKEESGPKLILRERN